MSTVVRERKIVKKLFTTKEMVVISLLSALAYVLMLLESPPYLGFLRLEFSDIPAIIGGIQFGPLAGLFIELIKNLIKAISATKTAGIGELANFLISIAYVVPIAFLYHKIKGKYRKITIYTVGIICMAIAGCLTNYFITIPLYATFAGGMENIIAPVQAIIPSIKDLNTLIFIGITPFNIVKGILMSLVSELTYKLVKNRL